MQGQSKIQKKNISQIIRKIFREYILKKKTDSISHSAGIWSDRDFDVNEYVKNLRNAKRFEKLNYE